MNRHQNNHASGMSGCESPPLRLASPGAPDPHLPPPISAATRRTLFGGFASMLLLVPAEAGAELDGELIAVTREALSCEAETERLLSIDEDHPGIEGVSALLATMYSRCCALPARTPEGLVAKATVLDFLLIADGPREGEISPEFLARSLVEDILGRR